MKLALVTALAAFLVAGCGDSTPPTKSIARPPGDFKDEPTFDTKPPRPQPAAHVGKELPPARGAFP